MVKKRVFNLFLIVVVLFWASFFTFWKLGKSSLKNWDEGFYVSSSYEFLQQPRLVLPYADGSPRVDRPPVGWWLQAAGMKLFGLNNFGIRFSNSLFFVGAILLLYLIIKKLYSELEAFILSMIFTVSPIFYIPHMNRSGDMDMYFLFFCLATILVYIYSWKKPKFFWLTGLMIGLGYMTRGYIALLLYFLLFLHIIWNKTWRQISFKQILFSLLVFLFLVLPWHLYAFMFYHDYFVKDYLTLSWRRIIEPVGHPGSQWYYLNLFWVWLRYLLFLFITGFLFLFWSVYKYKKPINSLWLLAIIVFFIPLQIMRVKLYWYAVPLIPFLFLACLPLFRNIFEFSKKYFKKEYIWLILLSPIMVYFIITTRSTWAYINNPQILPVDYVSDCLIKMGIKSEDIVIYNLEALEGPAIKWQWQNRFAYNLYYAKDNLEKYVNENKYQVFISNREGVELIEKANQKISWSEYNLEECLPEKHGFIILKKVALMENIDKNINM